MQRFALGVGVCRQVDVDGNEWAGNILLLLIHVLALLLSFCFAGLFSRNDSGLALCQVPLLVAGADFCIDIFASQIAFLLPNHLCQNTEEKIVKWQSGMEIKTNAKKTKIMFGYDKIVEDKGELPCSECVLCKKLVDNNSVLWITCHKWVH